MTIDQWTTSLSARRIALLSLRVTTGFLLVWFGLNKVVSGSAPLAVRRAFEFDGTLQAAVGLAAGAGEALVGALCVLGLWRRFVLPVQALINGSTAVMVWWAIFDPFRWYISGVDRIVFNSHVFYPTSITFAACLLLIAFREQDTLALDTLRAKRRLEPA
ncbi:DoxX family membrane protein [Rhizobiales bacterium]|uniref:DoxX family membrane protein n=1 Tax=Hongsoonwoonella zoysiae TaxID=2821844 RepID=UPI001560FCF6|nr:DoxX family membrane protein [Hongsoonwoonella zoysiae]NRG17353.1 DoxX family membrane protein [Hongsoonwoonella zoysiae]